MKKTPLFEMHQKLGAMMVDFAGWQMPLHYGSQIQEHLAVRQAVGMFDVSHMGIIRITGKEAKSFLRFLLANDVNKLHAHQACYTCLLNEKGGVLDDLIVYCQNETSYYLVVNAATTEKDLNWAKQQASALQVEIVLVDFGIIAIQGPLVFEKLSQIFNQAQVVAIKNLKPFHFIEIAGWFIARTGYTGEEGVEILLPKKDLLPLWQQLIAAKVKPIGLAARDTLRLEAGLNLYGHEMDEFVTPLECHLASTVDWQDENRHFIGKEALLAQKQSGILQQLVGLVLLEPGIPRAGMTCSLYPQQMTFRLGGKLSSNKSVYKIHDCCEISFANNAENSSAKGILDLSNNESKGLITSGSYSPTLARGIAMARIPMGDFSSVKIEMRGKKVLAKVISLPFLKKGKPTFSL